MRITSNYIVLNFLLMKVNTFDELAYLFNDYLSVVVSPPKKRLPYNAIQWSADNVLIPLVDFMAVY